MAMLLCLMLGAGDTSQVHGTESRWCSYLYQPAFCMDYRLQGPAEPYLPQPGDIFLATDSGRAARVAHWAAGTGAPQHSGIVIARPDGRLAILEAGPHNTLRCDVTDWLQSLNSYFGKERVWIRRRRVPLTAEQSCRLTAFALSADGKRFAALRLVAQLTPLRSRGPLRTCFQGRVQGERGSYFCSELVVEACVAAGLIDPATARPAATYPRDLFFARSRNRFLAQHFNLADWEPPARWTVAPGSEPPDLRRAPRLDGDGPGP
jgi:hypothetical protein